MVSFHNWVMFKRLWYYGVYNFLAIAKITHSSTLIHETMSYALFSILHDHYCLHPLKYNLKP